MDKLWMDDDWDEWYEEVQRIAHEDFNFHDRYMWSYHFALKRWRKYYEKGLSPREALRESRTDSVHKRDDDSTKQTVEQLRKEVKG